MGNIKNRYILNRQRLNEENILKRERRKWTRADTFALLAIVLGIIALEESVTNKQFDSLLNRTDNIISNSQSQLKLSDSQLITFNKQLRLNENVQKAVSKGDKNRFIAAIFRIGAKIGTKDNATNGDESEPYFIHELIPIFESQMNNPYLCQNDTMLRLWVNAYVHLNIVGHEGTYSSAYSDAYDTRTPSRIDELSTIEINRDSRSVWESVNEAYVYCGRKVKSEASGFIKN